MFADIKTQPHLNYDSDHLPIGAKMTVHWYFGSPAKPTPPIKHLRKCTPDAKAIYNRTQTEGFHLGNNKTGHYRPSNDNQGHKATQH